MGYRPFIVARTVNASGDVAMMMIIEPTSSVTCIRVQVYETSRLIESPINSVEIQLKGTVHVSSVSTSNDRGVDKGGSIDKRPHRSLGRS